MTTFTHSQINQRGWKVRAALAFGTALLLPLWSALSNADTLKDIKVSTLPGDKLQLRLELDAPPATKPLSFTIDNPARLALDLPGTTLAVPNKTQNIGTGLAQSVTAVEAGGRTRVVLNMSKVAPYDVSVDGSAVLVTVGEGVT
ncbi:MAG: AMIN domain-containing protein [Gammaproteobacteria bacterium]